MRLRILSFNLNFQSGFKHHSEVVIPDIDPLKPALYQGLVEGFQVCGLLQDFEFSYFDDIDDALIVGLPQNQDFFSMLLSNDEMKRQVLGIFSDEIYKSLRNAK